MRSLQVEKIHAINGLNQITNTHRNPASLVNFELLNNKLTKFISVIDDITRFEYRQNILSIFNLKFHKIYNNNMYSDVYFL